MMYAKKYTGFTLIELMLAMTFLSILLIAIATITIQVGKLYDRGQTLKAVNQSGRDVSDSLRRDAQSAASISNTYVAPPKDSEGVGLGRLCLGTVSYVWNTADNLRKQKGVTYKNTKEEIVLARVTDVGGNYCRSDRPGGYTQEVAKENSTEMLQSADHDLAVYKISMTPLVTTASNKLYVVEFTLGTNEEGTIDTTDMSCKPPDGSGDDDGKGNALNNFNFCAVNQFKLLVSVG